MANKDRNKAQALTALVECKTLTAAAESAGISRRTLYGYLTQDDEFARAYRDLLEQSQLEQLERVQEMRDTARETVTAIMTDGEQPAAIRLKAAAMVLELAAGMESKGSRVVYGNVDKTTGFTFEF